MKTKTIRIEQFDGRVVVSQTAPFRYEITNDGLKTAEFKPIWAHVASPEEARSKAEQIRTTEGGRIYRGHLPDAWHSALQDYPRS